MESSPFTVRLTAVLEVLDRLEADLEESRRLLTRLADDVDRASAAAGLAPLSHAASGPQGPRR